MRISGFEIFKLNPLRKETVEAKEVGKFNFRLGFEFRIDRLVIMRNLNIRNR